MQCEDRSLFEITGEDRFSFLQGLVTNDVEKCRDSLAYTALLTPQGKYIADFFLSARGEAILLDVATPFAAPLVQRLNMYRLRAAVAIEESTYAVSRGIGPAPEGSFADPRHAALGWRSYGAALKSDPVDWDALRVAHVIPESGIELTGDTYILEAGFERLNGIDFRKGCYVGQEIAARMKHKTELRKGLVQVDVTGSAAPGTAITQGGKAAGTLFTQSNGKGIAFLRYDRASGAMEADGASVTWNGQHPS